MHIYGEFTKIEPLDDGTIKVIGVASSGAIDDADETVLPEAMKAALPSYMRFGALREMHGLSAAGATLNAEVGDDGLTRIETHVVDPLAVKKVQLGVYKGFSIGGKVLARDPSDRRVITKIKLDEISLVDRPCNPEAVIDMWKADREPAAPSNVEVLGRAKALAAAAGKPGRHTDFVVKAREALVAEREGRLEPCAELRDLAPAMPLHEGDRNRQAFIRGSASSTPQDDAPADPSEVTDQIDALLDQLDDDDVAEVLAELIARRGLDGDHDDEGEDADKAAPSGGLADASWLIRTVQAETDGQIEDVRQTLAQMQDRLDKLAAQPLPPKAAASAVRAVSKADDAAPGLAGPALSADEIKKYLDGLPEDERGQLQLRAALRAPIVLAR
jgi:hypothetical protein